MARVGVQAMMIRDHVAEVGPYEALRKVADIGYRAVEISQIPMSPDNVAQMAKARDDFGIDIGATSAALEAPPGSANESLTTALDKIISDCTALDCSKVRIGMLPMPALRSIETIKEFCRGADEAAGRLAEHGVQLYYHNHHIEFTRFDGQRLLDIIRAEAPRLRFELDVHWIHRGGGDPVTVLREYAGLVDLVHLKDYRIARPDAAAFDSLASGDREAWSKSWSAIVQFAEVGEGNLDWKAIVDQSIASGADYLFVEQDDQYGLDPYACLVTSRRNLVALGYESLF
jgi:sugar phosphate isomerase/epimerase